jgi:hypothetical protein
VSARLRSSSSSWPERPAQTSRLELGGVSWVGLRAWRVHACTQHGSARRLSVAALHSSVHGCGSEHSAWVSGCAGSGRWQRVRGLAARVVCGPPTSYAPQGPARPMAAVALLRQTCAARLHWWAARPRCCRPRTPLSLYMLSACLAFSVFNLSWPPRSAPRTAGSSPPSPLQRVPAPPPRWLGVWAGVEEVPSSSSWGWGVRASASNFRNTHTTLLCEIPLPQRAIACLYARACVCALPCDTRRCRPFSRSAAGPTTADPTLLCC